MAIEKALPFLLLKKTWQRDSLIQKHTLWELFEKQKWPRSNDGSVTTLRDFVVNTIEGR